MTYEVEIKLPLPDDTNIISKLEKLGFQLEGKKHQIDDYYNSPKVNFAQSDEALRLRHDIISSKTFITYKGPKLKGDAKIRVEEETEISNANTMGKILEHLGFPKVDTVEKERTILVKENFTISLDRVKYLGDFIELEAITDEESKINESINSLKLIISALDLDITTQIKTSYLELLLER